MSFPSGSKTKQSQTVEEYGYTTINLYSHIPLLAYYLSFPIYLTYLIYLNLSYLFCLVLSILVLSHRILLSYPILSIAKKKHSLSNAKAILSYQYLSFSKMRHLASGAMAGSTRGVQANLPKHRFFSSFFQGSHNRNEILTMGTFQNP